MLLTSTMYVGTYLPSLFLDSSSGVYYAGARAYVSYSSQVLCMEETGISRGKKLIKYQDSVEAALK